MVRFFYLSVVAAVLLSATAPATAQITTNWTNTAGTGHMVHIVTNWDNGVPTSADTANFNQSATYSANFSFSTLASNNLNVTAGDVEFFSGLANQTYAVGSDVLVDAAALTLDNVDLDVGGDVTMQNSSTLTIDADAALVVGGDANMAGTVHNNGEIELSDGGGIFVADTPSFADLDIDGTGRVFVSGGSAVIQAIGGVSLRIESSNGHRFEAINGGMLTFSGGSLNQYGGTIHAGNGSTVVLNTLTVGTGINGGEITSSGTGEIVVANSQALRDVTFTVPSPGTLVVPASADGLFLAGNTTVIVDSENQFHIDPSVPLTSPGAGVTLQINGNYTLGSSGIGAVVRIFGSIPILDFDRSLIIGGTTTFGFGRKIRVDGGTFSTGAIVFGNINSDIVLSSGTFNLTSSDLELGTGMPFRSELQAGSTDINVTNGDVTTLADGVLNTNGNLTAQGLDNAGQVGTIGGSMTFSSAATNQATGQINAINATLNFNGGLTNNGQLNVINTTVNGSVNNVGGASVQVAGSATFNGDVSGTADFGGGGTTTFNAHYAPGESPDSVNFAGSVSFGSGATLDIEIGGLVAGTGFDQLVVAGDVTLDGSLDVTLISPFALSLGQSFEIVDVGGALHGTFSGLPQGASFGNFGGMELAVSYVAGDGNDVGLLAVSGLDGDYNNNGTVDAADYAAWRKNLGTAAGTLLNDVDGGQISMAQYNTWKANFGMTSGSGSGQVAAVPEPASLLLLLMAGTACFVRHHLFLHRGC